MTILKRETKVAFLSVNLNPDFAIENSNDLRLNVDRSDWYLNLVSDLCVLFNETAFRSQKRARSSVNTAGQG